MMRYSSNWSYRSFGLTRLEVLAIASCAALVTQLMLPLLGASRESARRMQCQASLRRIAESLREYHEFKRALPAASTWNSQGVAYEHDLLSTDGQIKFLRNQRPVEFSRENWVHAILPFLSISGASMDPDVPIVDPRNEEGRNRRLSEMVCPSELVASPQYAMKISSGVASFARGNYAINGGSQNIFEFPGWLTNPRTDAVAFTSNPMDGTFALWGNGVAGINKSFRLEEFENRLETTVLLDEIRSGLSKNDPRGTWALGQIGASITWGHGANGDARGPNASAADSDDIRGCSELHAALGDAYLMEQGMPCCAHCNDNNQATARSMHPGGVNVAMADGSVRFMGNLVDVGLWHVLHSRLTPATDLMEIADNELEGLVEDREIAESDEESPRWTTPEEVPENLTNSVGMQFVRVPSGQFMMGIPNLNNKFLYPDEAAPAHMVKMSRPFLLGIHEVTQAQFASVMQTNPSDNQSSDVDLGNCPVENVSWDEAREFCKKLSEMPGEHAEGRSYRLPTEAEWEYAARAGKEGPIAFSPKWDEPEDQKTGVTGGKEWKPEIYAQEVGEHPANAFGLHDMCGNVFEWTNDWYSLDYYRRSPEQDPPGPKKGYLRVVRGSYWVFVGPACVANPASPPWSRSPFIGFRVVCMQSPL